MNDNSFRGFDIDAERGYADKALWLNYLSVGFVGDEIPAVRYNIVRRGVPTGGGGPSEIQVPEAVRRANDPARFVDWLLSVLPATSPGDREKYLKNIRLQAYCRQIAGQPQPIIRVQDAVYRYEGSETDAVAGVSLTVERGEFLAVLGRNGSGKSTLAKLLNALLPLTSGEIYVDGIPAADENKRYEVRAACGMVFQNPDNQIVATIVEEDCAFGLENLGVEPKEIRRRVDEALAAVGMSEYAGTAPHMLSGGQKQRVAVAGVLAMRPKIIVFDESTAMLDPSGRAEVLRVARQINREEGITVVWITHFMEEAAQADRVIVMNAGRIALEGAPREVFRRVDEVRALGLDVPEMTRLAKRLRDAGLDVSGEIMTVEEMAVELCRLK